jgi:hypothetical protein
VILGSRIKPQNAMNRLNGRSLVLALSLLAFSFANAADGSPKQVARINEEKIATLSKADQERVTCIVERMNEIANIDRDALSKNDRKALREEMRALKNEAAQYDGYVIYVSLGAVIVILLLIILLA